MLRDLGFRVSGFRVEGLGFRDLGFGTAGKKPLMMLPKISSNSPTPL